MSGQYSNPYTPNPFPRYGSPANYGGSAYSPTFGNTFSIPVKPERRSEILITERSIRCDEGEVCVKHLCDDLISVGWYCGDTAVFTVPALKILIDNLDGVVTDGVWMGTHDHNDDEFFLLLAGDKLYANTEPEQNQWVSWSLLKKVLKKTMKQMKA